MQNYKGIGNVLFLPILKYYLLLPNCIQVFFLLSVPIWTFFTEKYVCTFFLFKCMKLNITKQPEKPGKMKGRQSKMDLFKFYLQKMLKCTVARERQRLHATGICHTGNNKIESRIISGWMPLLTVIMLKDICCNSLEHSLHKSQLHLI